MIYHVNNNQKKGGVAVLIADKSDFKTKKIIRDKERHYIMIKGSIFQENIVTLNVYVPNNKMSKYTRQKNDRPTRRERSTIITGNSTILLCQ